MFQNRSLTILAGAALSIAAFAAPASAQFTDREIVRPIVGAEIAPNADGILIYERKRNRTDFIIGVENLAEGAYTVEIGGVFRGFLSSVPSGRGTEAELIFSTRARGNRLPLNFEPRGQLIEIRNVLFPEQLVATGRLPFSVDASENQPVEFDRTRVRQELQVLDGSFATGRIDINSNRRKADARLRVRGLVPGVYVLRANDYDIGSLVSIGRGRGEIRLSTRPRTTIGELAFDPTNITYSLVRVDLPGPELLVMTGNVGGAQKPGGDLEPIGTDTTELDGSGIDTVSEANIMFESSPTRAQITIDTKDLPAGTYDIEVSPPGIDGQFLLSTFTVTVDEPPMDDDMMGDDDMMEGEETPMEPMLPPGVGEDNGDEKTTGRYVASTDGMDSGSDAMAEMLPADIQGWTIRLVRVVTEGMDTQRFVYFEGEVPNTTFVVPEDLFPMMGP